MQALQAATGMIYASGIKNCSRRCGGDSRLMTGTASTRRGDNAKQDEFALVPADKRLHPFFTAHHTKHDQLWPTD